MECVARLSDVSFAWSDAATGVFEDLNMEVSRGERVFVGGPSGEGKTTLLGVLSGVLEPREGRVEVAGERVDLMRGVYRDRFRADHVGYIHQLFNLIPYLSVVENVVLPCRFSRKRSARASAEGRSPKEEAKRLLISLGLKENELLGRKVSLLSVGQQQRVAAARALIGAPELVLADEPTSSLDASNRDHFMELLFKECAASSAALVFVSHETGLSERFDRSVRMEGGRCVDARASR